MLIDHKRLITPTMYAEDMMKTVALIQRYVREGKQLPGILFYFTLGPKIMVLVKDDDYKEHCARIRKKHYLFSFGK